MKAEAVVSSVSLFSPFSALSAVPRTSAQGVGTYCAETKDSGEIEKCSPF